MTILDIQHLTVQANARKTKHDSHVLLNNISCQIAAGEILAVIGPNGAGKSTLLTTVAGDQHAHRISGTISVAGHSIMESLTAQSTNQRARQIAVLPQFSLLNFPYHVHEVVGLGRIPHSSGKTVDEGIIDDALAAMDITFLKHRLYTQLSGGEKQRVQLARVLAQIWRPEDAPQQIRMLLLDEPTTALDLGHQQQLMQAIKTFAKQGVAVMMVLHDVNLAARYADKILALLCSEMVAYGTPTDVLTTDNVKRLFNIEVDVIPHPQDRTPVIVSR